MAIDATTSPSRTGANGFIGTITLPSFRRTNAPTYNRRMPLVSLERVSIAFGHLPLLDDMSLQIDRRERVALIGRNGSGKSTLLKIVAGEVEADAGIVWREPAL